VATIRQQRPDLLTNETMTTPIPTSMPPHYEMQQQKVSHIEDIGQPTTACFLTRMNTDPTNWYISFFPRLRYPSLNFL